MSMAMRVINGRGPAWRRAMGMFWEGVSEAGGQEVLGRFRGFAWSPLWSHLKVTEL